MFYCDKILYFLKIFVLTVSFFFLVGCGGNKPTPEQKEKAERYIKSLVDMGINIYGGELTDANILVLAVDAYPGANFDIYAQTYLEEALSKGLEIEGLNIVDIKDC